MNQDLKHDAIKKRYFYYDKNTQEYNINGRFQNSMNDNTTQKEILNHPFLFQKILSHFTMCQSFQLILRGYSLVRLENTKLVIKRCFMCMYDNS